MRQPLLPLLDGIPAPVVAALQHFHQLGTCAPDSNQGSEAKTAGRLGDQARNM